MGGSSTLRITQLGDVIMNEQVNRLDRVAIYKSLVSRFVQSLAERSNRVDSEVSITGFSNLFWKINGCSNDGKDIVVLLISFLSRLFISTLSQINGLISAGRFLCTFPVQSNCTSPIEQFSVLSRIVHSSSTFKWLDNFIQHSSVVNEADIACILADDFGIVSQSISILRFLSSNFPLEVEGVGEIVLLGRVLNIDGSDVGLVADVDNAGLLTSGLMYLNSILIMLCESMNETTLANLVDVYLVGVLTEFLTYRYIVCNKVELV